MVPSAEHADNVAFAAGPCVPKLLTRKTLQDSRDECLCSMLTLVPIDRGRNFWSLFLITHLLIADEKLTLIVMSWSSSKVLLPCLTFLISLELSPVLLTKIMSPLVIFSRWAMLLLPRCLFLTYWLVCLLVKNWLSHHHYLFDESSAWMIRCHMVSSSLWFSTLCTWLFDDVSFSASWI